MKKLFVVILICLSACIHRQEYPIVKAKKVVTRYLDSTGMHSLLPYLNRSFTQRKKYLFVFDYTGPSKWDPSPSTAYFTLDSTLSKVIKVDFITH